MIQNILNLILKPVLFTKTKKTSRFVREVKRFRCDD